MRIYLVVLVLTIGSKTIGQSLEVMPGNERLFMDVQWLEPLGEDIRWSVFSRTRATVDYDENTNLFSGAYLNRTTKSGIGVSLVGKIATSGAGADIGPHIFKAKEKWMLFGLASVGIQKDLEYSWFSIFRFTPKLNDSWKVYSSFELFTLMNEGGHVLSVQRIRLGLDKSGYQFGFANNSSDKGKGFKPDNNFGVFLRRLF